MLFKETVKQGTLDLISRLMQDQLLHSFYLVGGTALSLKIGHRESIDIDLFNSGDFDGDHLAGHMKEVYGADVRRHKINYVSGSIDNVDFDFISHKYPSIKPLETIEGIRMMSLQDIAAMKVNAIVNSGERVKDFIDIHYLLKRMEISDILDHYCSKYPNVDVNTAISSLSYHQDVDLNVPVVLKDKTLKWQDVSRSINHAVHKYHEQQKSMKNFLKIKKKGKDRGNDPEQGLGL